VSTPLEAYIALTRAAFPGFDAPKIIACRVVRDEAGRLSLQPLNAARDEAPEINQGGMRPVEVWPGIPGATSEPTSGEVVLVALYGRDATPAVIARAPEGQPGHTPSAVQINASSTVRLGTAPLAAPVARAAALTALKTAVQAFGSAAKVSTDPVLAGAALALESAVAAIVMIATTKLEAE